MILYFLLTATTGRSGPDGPLLHALSRSLPRASRTGRNYRAVCGASVRTITAHGYDVDHPRACQKCVGAGL